MICGLPQAIPFAIKIYIILQSTILMFLSHGELIVSNGKEEPESRGLNGLFVDLAFVYPATDVTKKIPEKQGKLMQIV